MEARLGEQREVVTKAFSKRMPLRAPSPVATITAIGVASPRASGHAITNTVMASVNAKSSALPTHQNQTANVRSPTTIAAHTSHCEARSASSCAGAFEFFAS